MGKPNAAHLSTSDEPTRIVRGGKIKLEGGGKINLPPWDLLKLQNHHVL